MNLRCKSAGIVAGMAACLALVASAEAQATADAILNKLVAKGILKQDDAEQLKMAARTNNAANFNNGGDQKFRVSSVIKSMELYGDVRFRYEYRAAQLGPEAGSIYDAENRWRYALRIGVRGDLPDDFYYGLRLETSPNQRSTWNTFGNGGGSSSPYYGPFSKANNYSLYVGQAYLGWRPASWLDVSFGRVPQPLYTTPMVWDSDFTSGRRGGEIQIHLRSGGLFCDFWTIYLSGRLARPAIMRCKEDRMRRVSWAIIPTITPTCWPGSWG